MLQHLLTSMVKQGIINFKTPLRGRDFYGLTEKGINYAVETVFIT